MVLLDLYSMLYSGSIGWEERELYGNKLKIFRDLEQDWVSLREELLTANITNDSTGTDPKL